MGKGGNEASAGRIDVDGNVNSRLLLVLIQDVMNLLYGLIVSCIRRTKNYKNTNRALIDRFTDEVWVESVVRFGADREDAGLDLKVAGELRRIRNVMICL